MECVCAHMLCCVFVSLQVSNSLCGMCCVQVFLYFSYLGGCTFVSLSGGFVHIYVFLFWQGVCDCLSVYLSHIYKRLVNGEGAKV